MPAPASPIVPGLDLPERIIGQNQPGFTPLPSWQRDGVVLTRWRLSWRERFQVLFGGNLWVWTKVYGRPLQEFQIDTMPPAPVYADQDPA